MAKSAILQTATVKLETTYGVDPVPTAAADGIYIVDIKVKPIETVKTERKQLRPVFGGNAMIVTGQWVKATVSMEGSGMGVAGLTTPIAGLDALWQALGFARTIVAGTSVTYTPASANLKSLAMYYYLDGLLQKILGARVESLDVTVKRNGIIALDWNLVGLHTPITDSAIVFPVLTAYQTPIPVGFGNTTLSSFLGSASGICLEEFKVSVKNKVPYRNLINCSENFQIVGREITGSFKIETPSIATKPLDTIVKGAALQTLGLINGTAAGQRLAISTSNMDVIDIDPDVDDLVAMTKGEFSCIPVAAAGGDDISFQYT